MNVRTDYKQITYYTNKETIRTSTMEFLHWFRFYVRNSDDFIRVPTTDTLYKFPNESIRLFFVMRSEEQTHVPCTYTLNAPNPLTYLEWCELVDSLLPYFEMEMDKILQKEVRRLAWRVYEFIGWTTDGLLQNPEENKQAFRFTGHIT